MRGQLRWFGNVKSRGDMNLVRMMEDMEVGGHRPSRQSRKTPRSCVWLEMKNLCIVEESYCMSNSSTVGKKGCKIKMVMMGCQMHKQRRLNIYTTFCQDIHHLPNGHQVNIKVLNIHRYFADCLRCISVKENLACTADCSNFSDK